MNIRASPIIICFSGNATAVRWAFENNPKNPHLKMITGAFTDREDAPGISFFRQKKIHLEILDLRAWKKQNRCKSLNEMVGNRDARFYYSRAMAALLRGTFPEARILIFVGFTVVITTEPFVADEEDQFAIINEHPADLTILGVDGKPLYRGPGTDAIERTIKDGCLDICTTAHFVTDEVDGGKIIAQSEKIPIRPDISAQDTQEELKVKGDGPLFERILELVTLGCL